jgi:hypothetical protein
VIRTVNDPGIVTKSYQGRFSALESPEQSDPYSSPSMRRNVVGQARELISDELIPSLQLQHPF